MPQLMTSRSQRSAGALPWLLLNFPFPPKNWGPSWSIYFSQRLACFRVPRARHGSALEAVRIYMKRYPIDDITGFAPELVEWEFTEHINDAHLMKRRGPNSVSLRSMRPRRRAS